MRVVAEGGRPIKRTALKVLIASVGISALLGVLAVVTGDFGELQIKTLLTAMIVAGASIVALACGAALELGRGRLYAPIGIWASVIGCAMALLGLWFEIADDLYLRGMSSAIMIAVFAGHAAAMSAANLIQRHRWVRMATVAMTALITFILLATMWTILDSWDEFPWRFVAVLVVLASAGTILVPVMARMGRDEFAITAESAFGDAMSGDEDIDPQHTGRAADLPACPHCGERLPASLKNAFP